ncbi:50S ribosomal protein L21 [Bacteroidota bacterium]
MYAIVDIAGQQMKVEKGQELFVHRLEGEEGSQVEFNEVLLIDNNGKVNIGTPNISNARVTAKILEHLKGDKVLVFKKKRRKGYQKLNGHRQYLSLIQIEEIADKAGPSKITKAKPKKEAEEKVKPEAKKDVKTAPKTETKVKAKPVVKVPEKKEKVAESKPKTTLEKETKPKTTAKKVEKPKAETKPKTTSKEKTETKPKTTAKPKAKAPSKKEEKPKAEDKPKKETKE